MNVLNRSRLLLKLCRVGCLNSAICVFGVSRLLSSCVVKAMEENQKILRRFDRIIKSEEDKRSYRGLELANRMKVLLISDPTTDKSGAALDVNIGFLSDPDELPGLAHFCEHMLFLGTKKYPNENDYNKFLSEHGGSSNASTYPDHTTYYFDVVPEHFANALDIFSNFFLCPLFTESMTDRELNAVNSENEKNLSSDAWRLDQLEKHNADPSHAFHKFGTGNKETLKTFPQEKGINVREELLKFHETWYSSNIMALVVLGKESLDELEELVVKSFSEVKDKNVEAPTWPTHPFRDDQLGTCVYVVPIKDIRNVSIVFPTPDLTEHYKSAPGSYISHLLGHEGPGSLLSALKARSWSNNLVAGSRPAPRGVGFFGVVVDLTEEGIEHVNDIVKLTFQYLNLLKDEGPQEWVQEEHSQILRMQFRFKDKESPRYYILRLVHNVQEYPLNEVLCANYMLTDWRPDIIKQLLNDFKPENVRVAVVGKKFDAIANEVEPWYGTRFKIESISDEVKKEWADAGMCPDFKTPGKNEFIPDNFDLYPKDPESQEAPRIIADSALMRVWFKQDDQFLLPKADLLFDFVSPLAYLDPHNCNLTHMLVQLFRDGLNEYAYNAELAGLRWDITNTKYGLILSIAGFNDKQHIFLEKVMEKLANFEVDPKRFEIYKENYIRGLNNFAAEQPYQHAVYNLTLLLTEHSWLKEELLAAVDYLTIDQLKTFIPQMLSKMHVECLIHGNVNESKAKELVQVVESKLLDAVNATPLLPRQLLLNRELKLEDGCNYVYEVENSVHKSSCIELYYQCGMQSTENNVLLELVSQIIQEPCFNQLRTKEQLGYIVFSGLRRANGVQGLRIIVQSERHPKYLDGRIENFLDNMLNILTDMSEEEYLRHKEALAAQKLEKPKQLRTQTNIYWMEITAQQYHFDRSNVEVACLRTLTKEDVIKFYKSMLKEMRRKLGVHVVSKVNEFVEEVSQDKVEVTVIEDMTVFKSMHEMHPLMQPYINITRKGNKCKL